MLKQETIDKFKSGNYKIHLFSAGWCATCLRYLPEIMRIISQLDLGFEEVEIYEVAPGKQEPWEPIKKHKISRVPTLVITKDENEIGRITEYPSSTWTDDFENIMNS